MRWIGRVAGALVVMVAALLVATSAHAGKTQPARGQLSVYTGGATGGKPQHTGRPHIFKPHGGLLVTVTRPGSDGTVVRQARTPSPSGHLVWNLPAGEYHVQATCTPSGKTVTVQAHSTTTVKLKCDDR